MPSFGQWYEEQKAAEEGGSPKSNSWFPTSTDEVLPLFQGAVGELPTFQGMKASLEAQLPQNVLGMSYQQRFQVFCTLLALSVLFFGLGFFVGLPLIAVRPQKFALCFTFGSLTFMGSFGILKGPMAHLQGMFTANRIVFTVIYLGSMFLTLYFTFHNGGPSGYVLVLGASAAQIVALLWYLISFLPGGSAGLAIVLKVMARLLQPVFVACAKCQAYIVGVCLNRMLGGGSS